MTQIINTLVSTGEVIDPDTFNNNFLAVRNVVNGNLDNSNIAAAAAIEIAKLQSYPADNTKFLRGDGTWAVPPAPVSSTVYRKYTTTSLANSSSPADLFNSEITIGANVMTATGSARIRASGSYLNNTAGGVSETIRLKLGGTTLWDSGAFNVTQHAQARALHLDIWIQALNATNAQRAGGEVQLSTNGTATTGFGVGATGGHPIVMQGIASTIDMTSARSLVFEWQHASASASISAQIDWAIIEVS